MIQYPICYIDDLSFKKKKKAGYNIAITGI